MSLDESDWTVLLVAADDIDAQLVAGRLAEEDIPTFLEKDRSGYGDYLLGGSNPHAPVSVLVPQERLVEARSLMAAESPDGEDEAAAVPLDEPPEVLARPTSTFGAMRTLRPWIAVVVVALLLYALLMEAGPLKDLIGIL